MGVVKESKLPCPLDDCNSSDAYHIFEDGSGWCFSCSRGTWERKTPDQLKRTQGEFRGVSKKTQETLGFFNYVDENNNVLYREYTYPNGASKWREVVPKKFWVTGGRLPKIAGDHLWNAGSSNSVCVVEGEEDAAAFMEMCDLPVYWLTSASLGTDLREIHDKLSPFNKIILAFESDEAGAGAKQKIGTMFPGKVYEASLSKFKDASDYLTNKCEKEFYWAVVNAKKYTADFVFNSDQDFEDIINDDSTSEYVPTPFNCLNDLVRGLPLGRIVLITGPEGLGKTEILRAMEYKVIKDHPEYSVAITHHEESKRDTLLGLASYELQQNLRDPDNPPDKKLVLETIKNLNSNGNLNLVEIGTEASTVKEVMDRFNYLVTVCGVKYFFVDPINQFTPPDDGDTNLVKFLDSLSKAMAKFVVAKNVCCVWSAHVNDEGQTRDSRMISKMAGIRIDISRDKMSEDDNIRNRTYLSVSKNRPYSKTGQAGSVNFNPDTFTMYEQELPF